MIVQDPIHVRMEVVVAQQGIVVIRLIIVVMVVNQIAMLNPQLVHLLFQYYYKS